MRRRGTSVLIVAFVVTCASGCLTEGYTWVPPVDASGVDASPHDIDANFGHEPGAVEGIVAFDGRGLGAGYAGPYAIRVWLYALDHRGGTDGGARSDSPRDESRQVSDAAVAPDARGFAVPLEPQCPREFVWPPDYRVDIEPARNPARYRIDDVPAGTYCLVVVRDDWPYFGQGEPPSCGDARTIPPIRVRIIEGMTSAPPVMLSSPPDCS